LYLLDFALTLGLAVISFLLGGIPFGLLLGKLKGIDVRKAGSGNIGAANVGRLLGRRWGVAVFVLDACKGLAAALIVGMTFTQAGSAVTVTTATMRLLASLFAVLGHNYSPYLGFRGGKGVATSLGVALGVYPQLTVPGLGAFAVWALAMKASRMSSVGSMTAGVMFPVFTLAWAWLDGKIQASDWPYIVFALLIAVLLIVRHTANIRRILAGTEPRIQAKNQVRAG
jgi:glycerol-3-phosphate acyltransferase PlsY